MGDCVKSVISNCQLLDSLSTCQECVAPDNDGLTYGGGINDYSLLNDRTNCVDNVANGTTNCKVLSKD